MIIRKTSDFSASRSSAFDLEIGQHGGELEKTFFQKVKCLGFCQRGGDMITKLELIIIYPYIVHNSYCKLWVKSKLHCFSLEMSHLPNQTRWRPKQSPVM